MINLSKGELSDFVSWLSFGWRSLISQPMGSLQVHFSINVFRQLSIMDGNFLVANLKLLRLGLSKRRLLQRLEVLSLGDLFDAFSEFYAGLSGRVSLI